MNKRKLNLFVFVLVITVANIYLWLGIMQGVPSPKTGRLMILILLMAFGAIFADKFSSKQYVPEFIRAGCLVVMTLMFFILYNFDDLT